MEEQEEEEDVVVEEEIGDVEREGWSGVVSVSLSASPL